LNFGAIYVSNSIIFKSQKTVVQYSNKTFSLFNSHETEAIYRVDARKYNCDTVHEALMKVFTSLVRRSTGGHYNPDRLNHGARDAQVRHVGDLGNVVADESGRVSTSFSDNVITLFGGRSIIGRAIVVHADEDDLGLTDHSDSHKTGNAGGRVTCGIIGIL
jgi:hypothetical protein